jgi:hypothetical protein
MRNADHYIATLALIVLALVAWGLKNLADTRTGIPLFVMLSFGLLAGIAFGSSFAAIRKSGRLPKFAMLVALAGVFKIFLG